MTETIPWDVFEHLKSEQDIADYLEAVFEEGEPSLMAAALADVSRAKERIAAGNTGQ